MQKINVIPFEEKPIDFKQINISDFYGYIFDDAEKTIIEPNEEGFISDALDNVVDLNKCDTTIINAGVGQGKTTAIIDNFVKHYYHENKKGNKYKIIIITPFKSLNKDYASKIQEKSGLDNIYFDYQDLDIIGVSKNDFKDFYEKPIQLISVKSLLGDAGTVAYKQKDIKREYYEYLISKCKENNEKVIFIFDEIHESLDTFNPLLLPNLYKWNEVIHKVIVASATFSEASKVVIKFLAELTNKRIKIIESKRIQQLNKLSELHLCFYNSYQFKQDDQYIKDLVEEQFEYSKYINILCFSEKLAKNIYNSSIGQAISNHYGSLNLVTGNNNEDFDFEGCNIGTKFKTGISIDDENTSLFIILPLKFAYADNGKNPFGIFTDRINSVIQAVARVRNKSKVFIIMPSPEKAIIYENSDANYLKALSLGYFNFDDKKYQSNYISLNRQDNILHSFYQEKRSHIETGINDLEKLSSDIKSHFPSYDWYKLQEGDGYLSTTYDIYGKNLSNYVYWAAWNNQFVNCKLTSIIKVSKYKFAEDNVQSMLDYYFEESFFNDSFFTLNSDKECYNLIRGTLYSNDLFYENPKTKMYDRISPYRNSNFEQQLITFIQRKKIPFNFDFKKLIYPPNGEPYNYKNGNYIDEVTPQNFSLSKETYIRICIAYSARVNESPQDLTLSETQIIHSYNTINKYKDIILNEYSFEDKNGNKFIPKDVKFNFTKTHLIELMSTFKTLLDNDKVLKSFSTRGLDNEKSIYNLLRNLFFETKETNKAIGDFSGKILAVTNVIPLPDPLEYINLIYDFQDSWLLQSGKIEWEQKDVIDEYTNDPFYGKY